MIRRIESRRSYLVEFLNGLVSIIVIDIRSILLLSFVVDNELHDLGVSLRDHITSFIMIIVVQIILRVLSLIGQLYSSTNQRSTRYDIFSLILYPNGDLSSA